MAIEANNIIEAKALHNRRNHKAEVKSLVRLDTPPDTLQLSAALMTTLELEEQFTIFQHEVKSHIDIDGLGYRNSEQGVMLQLGSHGRHRTNYGLRLLEEELGEITVSRNNPFSEKDLAILEHLLVPILYPLRNGLRYHTALATAYRDPLTGVSNRSAMEEALPREVERALRHRDPLSMLIIDLDHFKKINDGYGHAAGDCVLRTAAKSMRNCLRTEDRIFRFGGEEFVVLLPETGIEGAHMAAERIRRNLQDERCECNGNSISVTASIGIAQLEAGDNQHLLFDKADKAVYRAKALGRNQVMRYSEEQ